MSDVPKVRRADRLMSEERTREMMAQAYAGRLATVGADESHHCLLISLYSYGKMFTVLTLLPIV